MEVLFTLLAERQLNALHERITANANEERADSYINRIIDYCRGFAVFPERGTRREDISPGLRVSGFERRVTIAFVVTENEVLIEGVFYGGQNFEAAFDERE